MIKYIEKYIEKKADEARQHTNAITKVDVDEIHFKIIYLTGMRDGINILAPWALLVFFGFIVLSLI